jgi:magnesium transporter
MRTDIVTARDNMDQEALSDLFARHNLMMIPIVDAERRIKGIVTHDDIIDVLREEATEDIQKIGGTEALDAPYLQILLTQMIKNAPDGLQLCLLGKCSRPRRWVITKIRFREPLSLLCSFR